MKLCVLFKENAMSQQTKNAMKESLKKLIAKKMISKITIKDITDDCGVNRMTFYYHFKDIYDLLDWSIVAEAKASIQDELTYKKWDEGLLKIFHVILYNKKFYLDVFRSAGREYSEKKVQEYMQDISIDLVEEETEGLSIATPNKSSLAEYYKYALTGFVVCWVQNGLRENPDYIVGYISSLVKHGMASTITSLRADIAPYLPESEENLHN